MQPLNFRRLIIQFAIGLVSVILLSRLFFMQVLDPSYQAMAKNNVVREINTYPSRGLIYDRAGNLIVDTRVVYDILMLPKQVRPFDTLKFCQLLGLTMKDYHDNWARVKNDKGFSIYRPQVLFKQIPSEVYAAMQEYMYQFPGFFSQIRTTRSYSTTHAGHILGYLSEVNQANIDSSTYYKLGDYIGISGIERSYEKALRGERGTKYVVVDVHNREIGKYGDSQFDTEAVAGQDLNLTIDMELQAYAEALMQNKRGSVVAIDPKTGEILALVSSPFYDPNLLTSQDRGENMALLSVDPDKPLFNRALSAYYPPGSIFKPIVAFVALQAGLISSNSYYPCYGSYKLGRLRIRCHYHPQCYSVQAAIEHSCNAYFCHLFKLYLDQSKFKNVSEALQGWKTDMAQFQLGTNTHVNLPNSVDGYIPGPERYDRMYGKNRWRSASILSLSLGQGEIGMTPLQMAHTMAIIANRGFYYYPHVVKPAVGDKNSLYLKRQRTGIDQRHFSPIVDGMERVVTTGTAPLRNVARMDICGKTGTAQNPHGRDHSLFAAFAPKTDPRIAIAVIIENAGWGYKYAAPIASLIIEKYLFGEIAPSRRGVEDKMMRTDLLGRGVATPKPVVEDSLTRHYLEQFNEVNEEDPATIIIEEPMERIIQGPASPAPLPTQPPTAIPLPTKPIIVSPVTDQGPTKVEEKPK